MRKKIRRFVMAMLTLSFLLPWMMPLAEARAASVTAKVVSFTADKKAVTPGGEVTLTIVTNPAANYVIIKHGTDKTGGVQYKNAVSQGTDDSGNKVWTYTCAPMETQSIYAYANTSNTVSANIGYKTVRVTVSANAGAAVTPGTPGADTPAASGVAIYDIRADQAAVPVGTSITYTITTSGVVNNVWAQDAAGKYFMTDAPRTLENGDRTWTLSFKPAVSQTIVISANTAYKVAGAVSMEQTINVVETPAKINSARLNKRTIYSGESITVTITTNTEANYVWVFCDDKRTDAQNTRSTKTTKTWTATISPLASQNIKVFANTENVDLASVSTESGVVVNQRVIAPTINSATAEIQYSSYSNVYLYDNTINVTVTTNGDASYVWVDNGLNQNIQLSYQSTDGSGNKTWKGSYTLSTNYSTNYNQITVYASATQQYGKDTSRTVSVTNSGYATGTGIIQSFSAIGTAKVNQLISFTAVTDLAVDRLVITDSMGGGFAEAYSSNTSANVISGSTRTWTLSILVSANIPAGTNVMYTATAYTYNNTFSDTKNTTVQVTY